MRKRRTEGEETSRDTEWCPHHLRLLRSLYGPRLRSLRELLQDLQHKKVGNNEEMVLVRDGDSVEYLTLLEQSFAVLPEGAPEGIGRVTVGGEPTNQRWSQQQVVERSIQLHLREGASSNVLCFGYGQVQSTRSNKQISALRGPEYHHLNVATGFISTHLWVTLLARVGEERMLYLLSYAAIFVPLPNYCLLQVAGHSFSMGVPNTKQTPSTISTTRKSRCKLPTVLQQEDLMIGKNSSLSTKIETSRPGVGPCYEIREDVTRSKKRVRPSSWVRRKQRRRQGTHLISQRSYSTVEDLNAVDPAVISSCTIKEVELSKPEHRVGLPPRLIDRSAIFYHSSFSSHAGFPANQNTDILNTSNVNEADISRLRGSIFKALNSADTISGEASTSTAGKFVKGELIKNVNGPLGKMVRNGKRCNYARLLCRHCPLPSSLASPLPKVQSNTKASSLLKEAYATQEEIEVSHLPSAAANAGTVDFKVITATQQHCKQETNKRLSSVRSEFHRADINLLGSSKKICNMARSSKPRNIGPGDGSSRGKHMHVDDFRKPLVLDEIAHEENRDAGPTPDLAKLVTLSTSHSQVVNFLWAVCRSLVPEEFLCSERFRRTLCSGIASFVSLRRYETFDVQHLLNKLQTNTSAWPEFRKNGQEYQKISSEGSELSVACNKTKKSGCPSNLLDLPQTMLLDWLHWLFTEIIIPLIRSHFYVTEAENHRQNVLYYRKPVWAKIHMLSLNHLVAKCYTRLDSASVAEVLQKRVLGFSHIRMLPKHNGVRPIANLSSRTRCTLPLIIGGFNVRGSSDLCGKRRRCSLREAMDYEVGFRPSAHGRNCFREVKFAYKSINSRLRGVHTCLKYEQENHSEDLGASVFGYKDVYVKFLPYIMHLKSLPGGLPPMYLAVCDISRAYDTIKQDKLFEVVSGFLRLPVYHIRRYISILNTMGCARASYKQTCTGSDEERDGLNLFMDLAACHSHSILQDQGIMLRLKRGHILGLIEEHVKRNIVKIGPHFYLQKSGIAQGSVLSPLLCSVFFGHLDENILLPLLQQIPLSDSSFSNELSSQRGGKTELLDSLEAPKVLENNETVLLRLIDDSLLISTSQNSVARFVQLMHDGFEEYGCHANQQKTAVSFDLLLNKNQVIKPHGVYMTNDGVSFMRWSGLLINCCTLEVQADYTRYIGEPIKGSITVVRKANPGAQVSIKLCHFVRAKCHPMLYDLRINSPSTIRLNAYQAFLLCAMKFHAYLCSMERTCCHHPPFLLKAIEVTSSYMHGLLRKQMQEMGDSMHLGVTKEEVTWLALHAFLKVLNKKQSRYVELLFLIQKRLDMPNYKFLSQCSHLASARDDNRSTMFKFIIY